MEGTAIEPSYRYPGLEVPLFTKIIVDNKQ